MNNSVNKRTVICTLIIGTLCITALLALFPGSYSVDSWNMFRQVSSGVYNDWHAPMMTATWKVLYTITGQYYALYIAQMLLYWVFVYLLLRDTYKSWWAFTVGLAFGFLLLGIPQYIMKDSLAAIVFGIASVLLLQGNEKSTNKKFLTGLVIILCLLYGLFVRINAVVSFMVLVYLFTDQYIFKKASAVCLKIGTSIVFVIIGLSLNNVFNYSIVKAEKTYPQYKLKLLDVAGISILSGHDYMPSCISGYEHFNSNKLKDQYLPATIDDLYWPKDGTSSIFPIPNDELNRCVDASWQLAIKEHTLLYLQNRGEGFLYYLRLKKRDITYWNMTIGIEPDNPFHATRKMNFVSGIISGMYYDIGSFFFYPWVWLLLNSTLFVISLRRYRKNKANYDMKVLALIQLSAIVYTLSQFFIYQHDQDFRYHYWNMLVVFIGVVHLLTKRIKLKAVHL